MKFENKFDITYDFLQKGTKRRSGKSIKRVDFIVAHDTGNKNSTARNNFDYYRRNDASASAHTFIDDNEILEIIPATQSNPEKAWHVRYNVPADDLAYDNDANDGAIGIELCYGDNINFDKAYNKYVWYIVYIMKLYNLSPYTDLIGHFMLDPSRRSDPVNALRFGNKTWKEFQLDVINLFEKHKNEVIKPVDDKEVKPKLKDKSKPNLRPGMKSEYVLLLENTLLNLGYFENKEYLDDFYGQHTKQMVIDFQQDEDIMVDGLTGPQTWKHLQKAVERTNDESSVSFLKQGMSGKEVAELENKLEDLGYSLGSYKDDFYGLATVNAVKRFQKDHGLAVDGVYGPNTQKALKDSYKSLEEQPTISSAYQKMRLYDSDVHIYKTKANDEVTVEVGRYGVFERLSNMFKNAKAKAKINGGFFGGNKEHLGTLIRDGLYYYPPNKVFIDFIYYKNGETEIKHLNKKELAPLQNSAHWAIGTSWSLMQEGEINTQNADRISHSRWRNPRTFLGQKKDGSFILCVVDGRSKASKGVTANQEAKIAKRLGLWNAVNLDGGGSSEMMVGNKIVNSPSDGVERKIGTAIVVY